MIAAVRGEVAEIALDHAVIEAAGVGYKVMATPSTLATLRRGTEARLVTAMIVREDSMTLYGFADGDARDLFLTLLGVSGVGPKIALATLAVYDATALRRALADGDVAALTRVPGIGKRGAERMVLELRDKIGALPGGSGPGTATETLTAYSGRIYFTGEFPYASTIALLTLIIVIIVSTLFMKLFRVKL